MSIIPHLNPQLYDRFFIQNKSIGRSFSEFGGHDASNFKGFIPTGETVCFVLAGKNIPKRIQLIEKFKDDHFFKKENILSLQHTGQQETFWSGKLIISDECLSLLTLGQAYDPEFSSNFPASKIYTSLTLSDLVLNEQIMDEVDHMQTWMLHQQEIKSMEFLKKRFRKGYRALFYGPPGTGKTLTASLLGNIHNRSVYRIDLSQIVSKYIGETEKNLSRIFDVAENKDWILFFDEAESLFSKRTDVSDSKDKFANQETSYLLQRIEDFDGLIILATNLKPNIDRAFIRRFQSIIHFTLPMPKEREVLWRKALSSFNVSSKIDYQDLAKRFEVSGGAINNDVQFAWLNAKRYGQDTIDADNLIHGIMRELGKEGKTSNL
jgi:DNA polymerase III delta prime subunit